MVPLDSLSGMKPQVRWSRPLDLPAPGAGSVDRDVGIEQRRQDDSSLGLTLLLDAYSVTVSPDVVSWG
jgi:hypothetical protein